MKDETKAPTAGAQASGATTKKKLRRGVSNETRATSQLKFHQKDANAYCLFNGHLEDVSVDWATGADGNSFSGLKVPHLTMHFESNHVKVDERRHVYRTLFPQESNVDTIPEGSKAWQVDSVLNWIKHMLDVFYLKGREMTDAEEDAMSLTFTDFDANGEYVPVEAEEVLAGYTTLFTNFADLMNGKAVFESVEKTDEAGNKYLETVRKDGPGTPVYKNADGSIIPIYMKLLRYKKVKNEWRANGQNGDLAFDPFIGSGAIELIKTNKNVTQPPVKLRFDSTRESITPKEVARTPSVGGVAGGMAGGTVVAGEMPMNGAGVDAIPVDQGNDMPF